MLKSRDFARQSLELHLFFCRIMKEHSLFLALSFTPKDKDYFEQAENFRKAFDDLLRDVVVLSDGIVSDKILQSGEIVTQYTMDAEQSTSFYSGLEIPMEITRAESELSSGTNGASSRESDQQVYLINQRALQLTAALIKFKSDILENVLSCNMFTTNYPLLIDHIIREAKLYLQTIQMMQSEAEFDIDHSLLNQELFWNEIMSEHAKFTRGLLDPSENALIDTANQFSTEFEQLTADAKTAMDNTEQSSTVTSDSVAATTSLRDFNAQGTQGILECKVKSVIIPLLADHVLREANHYLRILNNSSTSPSDTSSQTPSSPDAN